ncbi:MAG: ComF family protein [Acidobacteriota bacterium]|nr:ComF family protein [Acidobacteriota bacterium]
MPGRQPRVPQIAGDAVRSLLAAVFPSDCRFCQASLFTLSRLPVCQGCLQTIHPIEFARCTRCGDLLPASEAEWGDACCAECAQDLPPFERAVNFGAYSGALRQLVHLLKYERVRVAAKALGHYTALACKDLCDEIEAGELLLIPVPAYKSRLRTRGFNQAELIARAARRELEKILERRIVLDSTILLRTRFAGSQVARTAEERREQVRGAFKVLARPRVKGRRVLLVDDVMTTGATAAECARVLLQAGATQVWVATPARALGRDMASSTSSEKFPERLAPEVVRPPRLDGRPLPSRPAQPSLLPRAGAAPNLFELKAEAPPGPLFRGTYANGES